MNQTDLLKQLIKIRSYSGEEKEIREFISKWFKDKNIKSFVQGENILVHFEGKDKTKAFIFNSHMDTVSQGDLKWKYGALNAKVIGNKIIGLGASDMKSGMASSMLLAHEISKGDKPEVDVWFTYVVKEEIDGSGTQSFADWFLREGYTKKYKDIGCIFTEPTSLTVIEHGHRGNMFIKAQTHGDSGHASNPTQVKKHSVRQMIEFSNVLQAKFKVWKKEFSDGVFEDPTVGELTSIQAGIISKDINEKPQISVESPNKFPSTCTATFDIRTTPKFHKIAFKRIVDLGTEMGVEITHAFDPSPAGYTDPKEKIVKIAQSVLKKSKLSVSNGSADLGFLTNLKIKSIILGPGEKNQSHKTNEFAYIDQVSKAVSIYKQIIHRWG